MYIDERLRRYLESEVPGRLCSECNAIIAAERQFNPDDVVARLFDARVLLANLPGFLMPDQLPADALPRRTQFEVVRGLGRMLAEGDLICEGDYRAFEASLARIVQRPAYRGRRRW